MNNVSFKKETQTKYLMLASGQADVYLRATDPFYGIGFPWEHCAGQVILHEAGGMVTDFSGRPLNYHQRPGSPIKDSDGLVPSNGKCHEENLDQVKDLFGR